jgi:hypothetical protein
VATFSKKVLRLLPEELTNTILRDIDALFEDNGIPLGPPQPLDNDSSERRERTRRYLASLDLGNPSHTAKLTGVYSDTLQRIATRRSSPDFEPAYPDRWVRTLRAEGFKVDDTTFAVTDPNRPTVGFTAEALAALAALTDAGVIHDHLARLGDAVDGDPRLAVSTAKALIESTAKLVLTTRGKTYSKVAKVPALVTAAQESLGLAAKAVSDENSSLRQVLQSLVTLAQGVTEIRNQVGVDHGAESVPTWVRPRHARLVVGAAQVWCQLMLETLADPAAPWRLTDNSTPTA